MCDNCKSPKEKIDGKEFIKLLLNAIIVCRERFKPKEMAYIVGQSNSHKTTYVTNFRSIWYR